MIIYPARKAQIALLIAKKITVPAKYVDFANKFLKKLAKVLITPKSQDLRSCNLSMLSTLC